MLCLLFGTAPTTTNQIALKNLVQHFRKNSRSYGAALDQIVTPTAHNLHRRAQAEARREEEDEEKELLAVMEAEDAKEEARVVAEVCSYVFLNIYFYPIN